MTKVEFREYKKFPKVERSEIFKEEDLIGQFQKRFEEIEKVIEESQRRKRMSKTREEAIEILSGMIVATHVKDISIGTVEEVRASLRFALSDMEKVEKLEEENARLKESRLATSCRMVSMSLRQRSKG